MKRENKAHTATVNRIARRYANGLRSDDGFDVRTSTMVVAVETSATLSSGLRHLQSLPEDLAVYVAITNKEMVDDAMRATRQSDVGVMDPKGNILKHCLRQPAGPTANLTRANEMAVAG